jgi:hypothetical protein
MLRRRADEWLRPGARPPARHPIASVTAGRAHVTLGYGGGFGNNVQVEIGDLWLRYAHLEAVLVSDSDQVAHGARAGGLDRVLDGAASVLQGRPRLPGGDLLDRRGADLATGRGRETPSAHRVASAAAATPSDLVLREPSIHEPQAKHRDSRSATSCRGS